MQDAEGLLDTVEPDAPAQSSCARAGDHSVLWRGYSDTEANTLHIFLKVHYDILYYNPIKEQFCAIFGRSYISSHKSLCPHPLLCQIHSVWSKQQDLDLHSQPGKKWSDTVGKHQHLSVLAQLSY